MIRIQNSFDKFENIAVNSFYFILRSALSLTMGFLTAKCTIFAELSPFSIILLSSGSKVGLIPTFCFLGGALGYLTNPVDLAVFKYISALTMIFVVYMVFEKSMRILKGDLAIIAAISCFTSGFLFLLAGNLTLFSVLLLVCESILVCCCVYFINYAANAFRRCCHLSPRELIAASVTFILILLSIQDISVLNLNLARILGFIALFLAFHCLRISHAAVFGGGLGIVLSAIENGGESVFTAIIVGTLVGCIFSNFSHRFAMASFTIAYYAVLFFFGKFPWSYWLFSEPPIAMGILFLMPKDKIKTFLSNYISVRNHNNSAKEQNKKTLEGCRQSCNALCPRADICYEKNLQEICDVLESSDNKIENNAYIRERLPFCIKPNAMQHNILMEISKSKGENFDLLIKDINDLSKKIQIKMSAHSSPVRFYPDEEAKIKSELERRKLSIQNIEFFEDGKNCKKCELAFSLQEDVLHENILRDVFAPYFKEGFTIKIAENNELFYAQIREKSNYIITCSALCKNKIGEQLCGDNAMGFSPDKHTYCLLLADGMGSGENARLQSKLAIDTLHKLISSGLTPQNALNLYRAVERFRENGSFATIDLCLINLKDGTADFYKAGAYDSFYIHNDKLSIIKGGGMPLGLSEYDRVKHCTYRLSDGDYLIMASDGLSALGTQQEASVLMNKNDNIRLYAQNILKSMPESTNDDITIIVAKFQKSDA